MRAEFSLCLARSGSLEEVKAALTEQAQQAHRQRMARIDADYRSCLLIRQALQEPHTSPAYRIAEQYLDTYRAAHKKILKHEQEIVNGILSIDDPTKGGGAK